MDELHRRIVMAKGQILEALGNLGSMSMRYPEVFHAERALRLALAELNGTARAGEPQAAE